jgi:hypothetical protein
MAMSCTISCSVWAWGTPPLPERVLGLVDAGGWRYRETTTRYRETTTTKRAAGDTEADTNACGAEGGGSPGAKPDDDAAEDWLPVDVEVVGADGAASSKSAREQRVEAFYAKIDSDLRIQRRREQEQILQEMQASARANDP